MLQCVLLFSTCCTEIWRCVWHSSFTLQGGPKMSAPCCLNWLICVTVGRVQKCLIQFLPHDAMHSAAYAVMQCLSRSWVVLKRKNIIKKISPHSSFCMQYSDGNLNPPNGGVACRWARQKSRFWVYIWLDCLCCKRGRRWTTATVSQVMTRRW